MSPEDLGIHFEEAAKTLRGAGLGQFQRNAKIVYFLDGLPSYFDWLSISTWHWRC